MRVSHEKRAFQRVPVMLIAHCRIGNRFLREPIADLSEGGLYLKTREVARQGTAVRVAIALPFTDGTRFCTLVGAVARVDRDARGAKGLGVSFLGEEISGVDRQSLSGFISGSRAAA